MMTWSVLAEGDPELATKLAAEIKADGTVATWERLGAIALEKIGLPSWESIVAMACDLGNLKDPFKKGGEALALMMIALRCAVNDGTPPVTVTLADLSEDAGTELESWRVMGADVLQRIGAPSWIYVAQGARVAGKLGCWGVGLAILAMRSAADAMGVRS